MDEFDNRNQKGDLFSKVVKAGKRTYFFDIKGTRSNDFYLTITESKKHFDDSGRASYEKHKMFLYPEDFEKYGNAFHEVVDLIEKRRRNEITDEDFERLRQEQQQARDEETHNEE